MRLNLIRSILVLFVIMAGGCGLLEAAERPPVVTNEITSAANFCRQNGGRPRTGAMAIIRDVNRDGRADWIIDYAKFKCVGTLNPFCGTGGCGLLIFLRNDEGVWTKAFDESVRLYRFRMRRGTALLEANFGGAACNKTNSHTCRIGFVLGPTKVSRMQSLN